MGEMWMLTDMIGCGCKYYAGSADFHILISDFIDIHFSSYLGYYFMLLSICKLIILNQIN